MRLRKSCPLNEVDCLTWPNGQVELKENLHGLCKDPDYAEQIGVQSSDQGMLWFRRSAPSMSLGRTARERDWTEGRVVNRERTKGLPAPRESEC